MRSETNLTSSETTTATGLTMSAARNAVQAVLSLFPDGLSGMPSAEAVYAIAAAHEAFERLGSIQAVIDTLERFVVERATAEGEAAGCASLREMIAYVRQIRVAPPALVLEGMVARAEQAQEWDGWAGILGHVAELACWSQETEPRCAIATSVQCLAEQLLLMPEGDAELEALVSWLRDRPEGSASSAC